MGTSMARRVVRCVSTATAAVVLGAGVLAAAPTQAATGDGVCAGMVATQHSVAGNQAPVLANDTASAIAGGAASVRVLANDTDADGDDLSVVSVSTPTRGDVCVDSDGVVEYFAVSSATGYTDRFTYGVTDGDLFRTATVTVTVVGVKQLRAKLVKRSRPNRFGKVTFTNPNNRNMAVLAGIPDRKKPLLSRTLALGATASLRTKSKRVVFFALVSDRDGYPILVDVGTLNTRTGRQVIDAGDSTLLRKRPSLRALQRSWSHQR